jgi:hypothetical protein
MMGSEEFGQGMSVVNRRNFRQFYLIFPGVGKHYPLRSELSWIGLRAAVDWVLTHLILLSLLPVVNTCTA